MNGMKTWGVATIVALSAGALGATDLAAQTASSTTDQARAGALVEEAEALTLERETFDRAADRYREAADLYGDLNAVEPLRMAARLAYYTGDHSRAYRDFVEAGETALAFGDVVRAASSFLDAAWIAREKDQSAQAVALLSRAEKLAQSPLIATADRRALTGRIAEQQQ